MIRLRVLLVSSAALVFLTLLTVVFFAYTRQVKVVNVAEWSAAHRELRVAATMPMCSCLTLRKADPTRMRRMQHRVNQWLSLQFGSDATLTKDDVIAIVARRAGTSVAPAIKNLSPNETQWSFAFDWAGAELGDYYSVKAYRADQLEGGEPAAAPLDMAMLFDISASESRTCAEITCPFDDLVMNHALGDKVGQNTVQSAFTGVRMTRDDRVIEAQATGRSRGAQGDCGCMLLEVFKKPVKLSAALNGANLGELNFPFNPNQPQEATRVFIPFDFGGTGGDDYYVISALAPAVSAQTGTAFKTAADTAPTTEVTRAITGQPMERQLNETTRALTEQLTERQIKDYVRILGQLDGMHCDIDAARFELSTNAGVNRMTQTTPENTQPTPAAAPLAPTQQPAMTAANVLKVISCPYQIQRIEGKLEGSMNLTAVAKREQRTAAGNPSDTQGSNQ